MHNLHLILIKADSAEEAATQADNLIPDCDDENKSHRVGGVASEDGIDDVDNYDFARWSLSFLDEEDGIPSEGTYFARAVAYLHRQISDPVILPFGPNSTHPDATSALRELSNSLSAFDADRGNTDDLLAIGRNLKHLSELIDSNRAHKQGEEIPQFYNWQLDHFGLTDLTEDSEGAKRYLVFIDTHS
jgi:hypothetical protein